jgi:hypothetical protein
MPPLPVVQHPLPPTPMQIESVEFVSLGSWVSYRGLRAHLLSDYSGKVSTSI